MAKKRINLAIDPELDKRWSEAAKRMGWSKSGMLEDLLLEILPYLEEIDPKKVVSVSMRTLGKKMQELGSLIDEMSSDNTK